MPFLLFRNDCNPELEQQSLKQNQTYRILATFSKISPVACDKLQFQQVNFIADNFGFTTRCHKLVKMFGIANDRFSFGSTITAYQNYDSTISIEVTKTQLQIHKTNSKQR